MQFSSIYENDGDQDFLVSTEWGSLKLFQNEGGVFTEITHTDGLNTLKGWWNGIVVDEFYNEGLTDIIEASYDPNRDPWRH